MIEELAGTGRLLGVDAGGSATKVVLVEAGRIQTRWEMEPLNALLQPTFRERLASLIGQVRPDAAGVGLPGISDDDRAAALAAQLSGDCGLAVSVTTDLTIAWLGAFLGRPGIVVAAGTGSFAIGGLRLGQLRRTGGHGFLVDDRGGAYWLGRRALRAALADMDGTAPATALRGLIEERTGCSLASLVRLVHASPTDRSLLAQFAPLTVTAGCAPLDDPVAGHILDDAADALAGLVKPLQRRFGPLAVAAVGGLLTGPLGQLLAERVPWSAPLADPAVGAALLAAAPPRQETTAPPRQATPEPTRGPTHVPAPQPHDPFDRAGQTLDDAVAAGTLPGAVLACGRDSTLQRISAHGWTEPASPTGKGQAITVDTLFDLASLTKVVATTPAVLRLVAAGQLNLDTPVQSVLADFRGPGKDRVTVAHLLTHTSGLPAGAPLASIPGGIEARRQALLAVELESPCGAVVRYSDLGFLVLGQIVERLCGQLDHAIAELVTGPLGLEHCGFRPFPDLEHPPVRQAQPGEVIAATELEADGTPRLGVVHDENARSYGGVAGHAGVFATAADVGRYLGCWTAIAKTSDPGDRAATFFPRELRDQALSDHTAGHDGHRGLGWVCRGDRHDQLGPVSEPASDRRGPVTPLQTGCSGPGWPADAVTHTGFTGTSIALDPSSGWWVVLLTNDVHFGRGRNLINPLRRTIHSILAPS